MAKNAQVKYDQVLEKVYAYDWDETSDIGDILVKIEEEMEKASSIEKEKLAREKKEYQEYLIQKRQSSWDPKSEDWKTRIFAKLRKKREESAKEELDDCLLEAKQLLEQGEREKEEREEQGSWDCEHHFDEQYGRQDLYQKKEEAQQAMDELLIESRQELENFIDEEYAYDWDEALDIGGILDKIEEEMEKASPIEKEKLAHEKKEYQEHLIQKRQSSWDPKSEDWKYLDTEGKKKIDDAIKDVMDALENAKVTSWGGDDY